MDNAANCKIEWTCQRCEAKETLSVNWEDLHDVYPPTFNQFDEQLLCPPCHSAVYDEYMKQHPDAIMIA